MSLINSCKQDKPEVEMPTLVGAVKNSRSGVVNVSLEEGEQ